MSQMISHSDLTAIFSNIEDIKMVNAVILSDFESLQAEQDFVIGGIGDVFCKHVSMASLIVLCGRILKNSTQADSLVVYQTYCGNFGSALKLLQRLRAENGRLAEFLKVGWYTDCPMARSRTNDPKLNNTAFLPL